MISSGPVKIKVMPQHCINMTRIEFSEQKHGRHAVRSKISVKSNGDQSQSTTAMEIKIGYDSKHTK